MSTQLPKSPLPRYGRSRRDGRSLKMAGAFSAGVLTTVAIGGLALVGTSVVSSLGIVDRAAEVPTDAAAAGSANGNPVSPTAGSTHAAPATGSTAADATRPDAKDPKPAPNDSHTRGIAATAATTADPGGAADATTGKGDPTDKTAAKTPPKQADTKDCARQTWPYVDQRCETRASGSRRKTRHVRVVPAGGDAPASVTTAEPRAEKGGETSAAARADSGPDARATPPSEAGQKSSATAKAEDAGKDNAATPNSAQSSKQTKAESRRARSKRARRTDRNRIARGLPDGIYQLPDGRRVIVRRGAFDNEARFSDNDDRAPRFDDERPRRRVPERPPFDFFFGSPGPF